MKAAQHIETIRRAVEALAAIAPSELSDEDKLRALSAASRIVSRAQVPILRRIEAREGITPIYERFHIEEEPELPPAA
jgi:hypothetical protein